MVDERDVRAAKFARAEFLRRGFDVSACDIRAMHGVLHINGTIRPAHGMSDGEFRHDLDIVVKALKSKPEVRDVLIEGVHQ